MKKILPLSGLRVLDLTHLLPGPFLTLLLADLGAEVIKIERGPTGDFNRQIPPFYKGMSSYFMMLNRNKKSVVLDLKSKSGKKHFLKLVKKSDLLVENFRPGVMKRLGLGYLTLKKINPKLIYCAITGYGQTSPWKKFAGHDLNYTALSGILYGIASRGKKPEMLPIQLSDLVGGSFWPALSIFGALELRRKTGEGLFIDSAMLPGTVTLLTMVLGKFLVTGEELGPENDRMTGKYPNYAIYLTKDRRAMVVAAIEPKFWNVFCKVIGKPDFKKWVPLTDAPGFPTQTLATCSDKRLSQMRKELQAVFIKKTQRQWIKLFKNEANSCCTPVTSLSETVSLLNWLGFKSPFWIKDAKGAKYPQWAFPWGNVKLSRRHHTVPPNLGSLKHHQR